MASETTVNLGLPFLAAAQAQKHVTHNEALKMVDAIVQLAVLSRKLATPPPSPAEGDRYIVATAATGAWSGKTGYVAAWLDGVWEFLEPRPGWIAWVAADSELLVYTDDTTGWTNFAAALFAANIAKLGVNTIADATNRLSVKSDAVLLSHDDVTPGTGHLRVTVNKAAAARDAGIVFQNGWSSRALIGLYGSDDFAIKVSPDGAAYYPAIAIDRASGRLSLGVDLAVSEGGTGASTPARARFNLGFRANIAKRNRLAASSWLASASAADNNWFGVCWAPELSLFCAVASTGTGNRVMTSPDGITWTQRTSAVDNAWRAMCWSPQLGLFCAVATTGTGNRVMTSPDGVTWTQRTSAADNDWFGVCWAAELSLFCAVAASGTGNRVMTSPDGITWTQRTSAADNAWRMVCWSPELGLLCAIADTGTGNRVMTSPDGITWTARTSAADNGWYGVCWAAELGLFCAVSITGTGNCVMTSPDGVTWTARASAADLNWASVAWAAEIGLFCAVAASGTGNRVMTSPDGVVWTARVSAVDNKWYGVCWAAELGLFCTVAYSGTGNRAMTSVSAHTLSYRSA